MRRVRVKVRGRTLIKNLPISNYRTPGTAVPQWMRDARSLTNNHPITGASLTDRKTTTRIIQANQKPNETIRDFSEKDAEDSADILTQIDMGILGQEND